MGATISPYVIAKIGIANSKKLFCCAENYNAEGAKGIGFVQEVVENMKEGHERVKAICDIMTECGSSAVVASKRMCVNVNGAVLGEALAMFTCIQSESASGEDYKLGSAAQ